MGLRDSIKIKYTTSTNAKGIFSSHNSVVKNKINNDERAQSDKEEAEEAERLRVQIETEARQRFEAEEAERLRVQIETEARQRFEAEEEDRLKILEENSRKDLEERQNNTTVIEFPCRFEVLYENNGIVILNLWPIDGIIDDNLEQIIESIKDSFHIINILREDPQEVVENKKNNEVLTSYDMKTNYNTEIYDSETQIECIICLGEISKGTEIRKTKCNHIFHNWCLAEWAMVYHASCPKCRESLITT